MKKNRIFLLLCCALLPALLRAQAPQERESILIISSYNPDTRRMSGFIAEFERNIVASGIPCDIYVETLECKSINDAPIWMSQTENMISRYENKGLRAIVLLGQEAWASFVSLGHIPKDVMCFCCYVSSNGIVLPPPEDSLGMWLPPSINYMNMTDSLNNVGGMLNKYDVRRNIELVRSLFPEAENIAFISDNTYGGISLQALVREEMKNYPDMNLVLVDSREGDDAMHETYASLSHRSAAILGTWRVGRDGEHLMQRSLNDLVQFNPRIPVFSISQIGIGDVVIGKTVLYHDAQLDMICQNPPFLKEYTGDATLIAAAEKACTDAGVKALVGKIATGDLFVGDSATKAAIEAKCAPDCVEMEGAAVSQIAAKNGVPCVILRAMSDNADEDGHEVLIVKKFSIGEYVATATKIVAAMVEFL